MHHLGAGEDVEAYVRNTAKYGVAVTHKDVAFPTAGITRVRVLGDVAKD